MRIRVRRTPATPLRRTPATTVPPADQIAAIAATADTDPEQLRREVAGFRIAMEADLLVAAAAVEADAPDIANDVITSELRDLQAFSLAIRQRLAAAPEASSESAPALAPAPAPRRRGNHRRAPLSTVLAAGAALVAGAGGAILAVQPAAHSQVSADQLLAARQAGALEYAATQRLGSAQIAQAAEQLHERLVPLLAEAAHNPAAAQTALQLLTDEETLLTGSDPKGNPQVAQALAQARALLSELTASVSPTVLAAASARLSPLPTLSVRHSPTAVPTVSATPRATPTASSHPATPTTNPSATPSASPSHSPSSSSSSSSSTSSSKPGPPDPTQPPLPGRIG